MYAIGLLIDRVALLEFVNDGRLTGGSQERRQPIMVLHNLVGYLSGRNPAWPANHLRYPERALPAGVLLAAERGGGAVRPTVGVRTVVGGVHDDGVLSEAQFVEAVE